ncbi:MAG: acetoin utilization protein AcuC [Gammaproteobacteria bacterium]|nr:acetoin utilization protein AcuC [Gammaproteobacteria bacterium]
MEKECVGVFLGESLAEYHFGPDHPFGDKRYTAFMTGFKQRGLDKMTRIFTPGSVKQEQLALFHTTDYIQQVRQRSEHGVGYFDQGDTPVVKGIYQAAATVVGTTLKAIDVIMQGKCNKAFVPIAGLHHARRDHAAGFCVFNDCGVAIEYLKAKYNLQRIAYVDIDAHHGDGVFYEFEYDPVVTIIDFHGDYMYPGTGAAGETGKGRAEGRKLNIPLPIGADDELALTLWPAAEAFLLDSQPEFIILQCGADSIAGDPITHLRLSQHFHRHVAERCGQLAKQVADGRVLALGGGGYNLENIAEGWNAVIEGLLASSNHRRKK